MVIEHTINPTTIPPIYVIINVKNVAHSMIKFSIDESDLSVNTDNVTNRNNSKSKTNR